MEVEKLLAKTLEEKDNKIKEYLFDSLYFRFQDAVKRGHEQRVKEKVHECNGNIDEWQAEHYAHKLDMRDEKRFYELLREAMDFDE